MHSFKINFTQITLKKKQKLNAENKPIASGEANFAEFLEDKEMSDATFICSDDKKIPVHRVILAKKSQAFKDIFKEMKTQLINVQVFRDVDSDTMKEIIKHIYSGNANLTDINLVSKVYTAAKKFDLSELQLQCVDALSNQIDYEKVLAIFETANKLELFNVEAKAVAFIMEWVLT